MVAIIAKLRCFLLDRQLPCRQIRLSCARQCVLEPLLRVILLLPAQEASVNGRAIRSTAPHYFHWGETPAGTGMSRTYAVHIRIPFMLIVRACRAHSPLYTLFINDVCVCPTPPHSCFCVWLRLSSGVAWR